MVRLTAHYDGKVLVPDEPVELPRNVPLSVVVQPEPARRDSDGLESIHGLGAEIWGQIDAVKYQQDEREGWR